MADRRHQLIKSQDKPLLNGAQQLPGHLRISSLFPHFPRTSLPPPALTTEPTELRQLTEILMRKGPFNRHVSTKDAIT